MLLLAGLAGFFLLESPWNIVVICLAALVEVGEVAFWIHWQRRYRVRTGAEGLIGERAEAIDAFAGGAGRVRVYGEIWSARSTQPLASGQRVRVAAVDGLTLEVEPEGGSGTEKGP